MKINCGAHVDISDTVAIGATERSVEVGCDTFDTASGHSLIAGIHDGHSPRFRLLVVDFHGVVAHIEGDIGHVQEVVGEVFLDDVSLVASADDKVIDAVKAVNLEDVPQDRASTDFDHGFRLQGGFFAQACAQATSEDYGFHEFKMGRW